MFSAKELKNHVIYTWMSRKHLYKWEGALPTRWGLLAQEMLRVRPVASHSLFKTSSHNQSGWKEQRVAPARSNSWPSGHGHQLRPIAQMKGREEGESS